MKWFALLLVILFPTWFYVAYLATFAFWMAINPIYSGEYWTHRLYFLLGTLVAIVIFEVCGIRFLLKKSRASGVDKVID